MAVPLIPVVVLGARIVARFAASKAGKEAAKKYLLQSQKLEKQILALLAPFFKSKNPKVVAQVNKIKELLAKNSGRQS